MKQAENKQDEKNMPKITGKIRLRDIQPAQAKLQLVQRIELVKKLYSNCRKWR